MRILAISPDDREARSLIDQSDRLMTSLYPSESNHLEDPEALKQPNVLFVGAYMGEELVGCGAVKILSDKFTYGEIKRVFVPIAHRGKGIAIELMSHLENHLIGSGIKVARLETGVKQPEALGLYRRLGYIERSPFGPYREDPLSTFMEKDLGA